MFSFSRLRLYTSTPPGLPFLGTWTRIQTSFIIRIWRDLCVRIYVTFAMDAALSKYRAFSTFSITSWLYMHSSRGNMRFFYPSSLMGKVCMYTLWSLCRASGENAGKSSEDLTHISDSFKFEPVACLSFLFLHILTLPETNISGEREVDACKNSIVC